jgi:hypothetical protein
MFFSPCRFFPSIFFIAFLAVSLHEELKNTTQIFSKKNRSVGTSPPLPPPQVPMGVYMYEGQSPWKADPTIPLIRAGFWGAAPALGYARSFLLSPGYQHAASSSSPPGALLVSGCPPWTPACSVLRSPAHRAWCLVQPPRRETGRPGVLGARLAACLRVSGPNPVQFRLF